MEAFDKLVKDNTKFLDNEYVSGALTVFLIVYSSTIVPKLPDKVLKLFDYTLVKLFLLFLIVLISRKNATVSIVAAVALVISVMALDRFKFNEEMMSVVNTEEQSSKQISLETCTCTCDCLDNIVPVTDDGKLVIDEVKNAVMNGALPPMKAEELAKHIVMDEAKGKPVLVASTQEGQKRMDDIKKNFSSGKINEETARKMESIVVVAEAVMEAKMNADGESRRIQKKEMNEIPRVEEYSSVGSFIDPFIDSSMGSQSIAEMAQEVRKRRQEETNRRGGVPLSSEELKKLCANVLGNHKKSVSSCRDCDSKNHVPNVEETSIGSIDPMSTSYASV